MIEKQRTWRRECGQALILVAVAMPLFMSIAALVVDGTNLMVHRRQLQTAADAASLAAAQQINGTLNDTNCAVHVTDVQTAAECYSGNNGGSSSLHACNPADPTDSNCYSWPYNGNSQLVEVRLRESVGGFITGAVDALLPGNPLGSVFNVSARSVASANPVTGTVTTPGTTVNPVTDPNTVIPGGTHTTTDPDTILGGNGVGFALSRRCDAISYTGAGASGTPLGAFDTNGGLTFSGNAPKKVGTLVYNQTGCASAPATPPSGTSACTATAWGDASDSNNLCAKTLVDLNAYATLPINFPLTPPAVPTPASTWTAATDYPSKCFDLGSGNVTFTTTGHPPGIYCVSGARTSLTIPGLDLTGGDGYTFFALGGASIEVNGNPPKLKYYWPSACGPRPTTRASFTCFGRTISNYDPFTLLYATNPTNDGGTCNKNAICLDGQNGSFTGDMFAPSPAAFPPTPGATQTGGTVFIAGGAVSAGSGFIESWMIAIQGNFGTYTGTGPGIDIPGATHTTTDPSTTIFGQTHPGTTVAGSTQTITTGTTIGLNQ